MIAEVIYHLGPENPVGALCSILLALLCVNALGKETLLSGNQTRVKTIDGLRGYLAFLVFLHHCVVWHGYLKSGQWKTPESILYANFGSSSVALFFMITGFLFYTKLIKNKNRQMDWFRLYWGRACRLVPVYLFVIIILGMIVVVETDFKARAPWMELVKGYLKWLLFTIQGAPDLNGLKNTFIIVAGVTWTLPHEWKFYGILPLLSLTQGVRPPWILLGLSFLILLVWHPHGAVLESFIAGLITAILVDKKWLVLLAGTRIGTWLTVLCLLLGYAVFPDSSQEVSIFFLGLAFCMIASGNTLFGLMEWSTSRLLGEMTYSIYLLHGVVLFLVFGFVNRVSGGNELGLTWFWVIVLLTIPILLGASYLSYKYLEQPGMRAANLIR